MRFWLCTAAVLALGSAAFPQTTAIAIDQQASQPLKLVRQVRPVYPPEAKAAGISGRVRLAAAVNNDGTIQDLTITSGHPLLGAAAYEAVRQWQYAPLIKDGEAVAFNVDIDLDFSLTDEGPRPVQVPGSTQQGKLVNVVKPVYPPEARAQHIQGMVRLRAVIGKTGAVESVYVRDGHPALATAAVDAVRQWQYSPTTLDGEPVAVITDIDVNFTLSQ